MVQLKSAVRRNQYGMAKMSKPRIFTNQKGRRSSQNTAHIAKLDKPNHLEELPASVFSADPLVQREINEGRVAQLAADFRPHSLGLITASKRVDGRLYTLDGQHRIAAARQARYDGLIATRVFENLTLAEEAGLFLTLNSTRKVEAIDRFKVRVVMGEPEAVAINKILKRYDLHVQYANTKATNTISAVVTLEYVYHGAGILPPGNYADLLDNVLKTIRGAYGKKADKLAFTRSIVEGLGIFHAQFGKLVEMDRLANAMASLLPQQITAQARETRDRMGGSIGEATADVIHRLYNKAKGKSTSKKLPHFGEVAPSILMSPENDPLFVDPNQYVIDDVLKESEKAKAS